CVTFLGKFYQLLKDSNTKFNSADIETALCYYIGATSDAATKMINEVSKPLSSHVPVDKGLHGPRHEGEREGHREPAQTQHPDRRQASLSPQRGFPVPAAGPEHSVLSSTQTPVSGATPRASRCHVTRKRSPSLVRAPGPAHVGTRTLLRLVRVRTFRVQRPVGAV
ncbi:unnamed protein product, partial [Menidia menidia]